MISERVSGEAVGPADYDSQRLPTATVAVAFAMIAGSKVFQKGWRTRLRRPGVKSFASVHASGDGASWVRKSVSEAPTGCVRTPDVFHACEHISRAAQGVFGEGTPESRRAFERGRTPMIADGWNGICEWIGESLKVEDEADLVRRRAIVERVVRYFGNRIERLNYAERLSSGRAIGSGVVEGQAKTPGLRLKRRGARWKRSNIRPMASSICVRHSVQWQHYWDAVV